MPSMTFVKGLDCNTTIACSLFSLHQLADFKDIKGIAFLDSFLGKEHKHTVN